MSTASPALTTETIGEIQDLIPHLLISLGDLASNLAEAKDWNCEPDNEENTRLSLEAVSLAAGDAMERLRAISLKCEEELSHSAARLRHLALAAK